MANKDVRHDDSLLEQIFDDDQPLAITIFIQNWNKCVFKAEFPQGLDNYLSPRVVRLEAENSIDETFATIATLQQLAANALPGLVPQTFGIGKAKDSLGRTFHFSVTELLEGQVVEDVWDQLSEDEQVSVIVEFVAALEKIHSLKMSDKKTTKPLAQTVQGEGEDSTSSFLLPGIFGGPHTGCLNDGPSLLSSIMARRKLKKQFRTI
jgi:hypothetical protein